MLIYICVLGGPLSDITAKCDHYNWTLYTLCGTIRVSVAWECRLHWDGLVTPNNSELNPMDYTISGALWERVRNRWSVEAGDRAGVSDAHAVTAFHWSQNRWMETSFAV